MRGTSLNRSLIYARGHRAASQLQWPTVQLLVIQIGTSITATGETRDQVDDRQFQHRVKNPSVTDNFDITAGNLTSVTDAASRVVTFAQTGTDLTSAKDVLLMTEKYAAPSTWSAAPPA
jgi:hypothetical protein